MSQISYNGSGQTIAADTIFEGADIVQGFHCDVGGTLNYKDGQYNDASIIIVAGMYYPYMLTELKSAGTTATIKRLIP